jgi:tetrahydromethanopterin S-methyltransferase subunit B
MGLKQRSKKFFRGWLPKDANIPNSTLNINSADPAGAKFQFNRRFWLGLGISYGLFGLLVVVPFLLGYIDATIVGYGLTGIGWSLACMAIVYLLNRRPDLRKRMGYVVGGVWIGFAVFALFALVLFPRQFLAAGSWAILLLITVAPAAGGVVGYFAGKRKYPGLEEIK